jgi:hypothetical protein
MFGLLLATALSATYAQDTGGVFDPSRLKGPSRGTPNEVMVLGTPHLSQLPKSFDPAALNGLLDRLAAWKPQIIAIEAVSGPQCDFMRHYPQRYQDTVESYCWDPAPARAATGLDVPAATAQAERMLANWPAAPAPAQRRKLASLFLAGAEQPSALVQWLRLPQAERHAGDGLDAVLVARLEKLRASHNEDFALAAPLAARLGLENLVAMDDHSSDFDVKDEKAFGEAMKKAWDNPFVAKRRQADAALQAKLDTPEAVLAMYRADNDPSQARLIFDSDFGAAMEDPSKQGFGRQYLGAWETRNLRMASNIRDALQAEPGKRELVVVGASHKWYLQAYLNQMHDVRVVDIAPLLR